jgi:hypothetical protein
MIPLIKEVCLTLLLGCSIFIMLLMSSSEAQRLLGIERHQAMKMLFSIIKFFVRFAILL